MRLFQPYRNLKGLQRNTFSSPRHRNIVCRFLLPTSCLKIYALAVFFYNPSCYNRIYAFSVFFINEPIWLIINCTTLSSTSCKIRNVSSNEENYPPLKIHPYRVSYIKQECMFYWCDLHFITTRYDNLTFHNFFAWRIKIPIRFPPLHSVGQRCGMYMQCYENYYKNVRHPIYKQNGLQFKTGEHRRIYRE